MTFKTLTDAAESLSKLSQEKIKVSEAVKLARLIKKISGELDIFNEQRKKLLDEFGELNEKENRFEFKGENAEKFKEAFDELLNTETEEKIEKVKILSDVSISAADALALEEFVEFE